MIRLHFSTFASGEKISVEYEAEPKAEILTWNDLFSQKSFCFLVDGSPCPEVQTVAVKLTADGLAVPFAPIQPAELHVGQKLLTGDFYSLHPGKIVLELENTTANKAALFVWQAALDVIQATPDVTLCPA